MSKETSLWSGFVDLTKNKISSVLSDSEKIKSLEEKVASLQSDLVLEIQSKNEIAACLNKDIERLKKEHEEEINSLSSKLPTGDHAKDILDIHNWLSVYALWMAGKITTHSDSMKTEDKIIANELKSAHKELFRLINSIEEIYKIRKSEGETVASKVEKAIIEDLIEKEFQIDQEERKNRGK